MGEPTIDPDDTNDPTADDPAADVPMMDDDGTGGSSTGSSGSDDALAARFRSTFDALVAPVALDDVHALATGRDRDGDRDRPAAASPSEIRIKRDVGPRAIRRRRAPLIAAAAAAVLLVIGAAILVARDGRETLDVGIPPGVEQAGGIFDPSAAVLQERRVSAMVAGADGLLAMAYVAAPGSRPDGPVGEDREAVEAEAVELENQAAAVDEEVALLEAGLAPDPSAPSNLTIRREADGLRERAADLRFRAAELRTSSGGRGYTYGVLLVDASTGAVTADHPVPERVREESMVTVGSTLWFTTASGDGPNTLWRSVARGAPEVVEELPGRAVLAGDGDALWLRGTDVVQRRDPATGAVLEEAGPAPAGDPGAGAPFPGFGSIATGESGTFTVVPTDQVVPVEAMRPGPALRLGPGDLAVRRLWVAGPSVFVVDGTAVTRVDAATGESLGRVPFGLQILGADARAGRFWLARDDDDPGTALVEVVVVDGTSGEERTAQVAIVGDDPTVAALEDGDAVLCVTNLGTDDTVAPAPPAFGSSCRRVGSPFATAAPTPSVTAVPDGPADGRPDQDDGRSDGVPRTTSTRSTSSPTTGPTATTVG